MILRLLARNANVPSLIFTKHVSSSDSPLARDTIVSVFVKKKKKKKKKEREKEKKTGAHVGCTDVTSCTSRREGV